MDYTDVNITFSSNSIRKTLRANKVEIPSLGIMPEVDTSISICPHDFSIEIEILTDLKRKN